MALFVQIVTIIHIMELVIGLDLGTTACKAVALDSTGRVVATAAANAFKEFT